MVRLANVLMALDLRGIARAIAVRPEVILMDEPASALDPIATLKIEELMQELNGDGAFTDR